MTCLTALPQQRIELKAHGEFDGDIRPELGIIIVTITITILIVIKITGKKKSQEFV